MRILVTGGAGYVGSVLVPILLQDGHEVTVLDSLSFGGESLLGVWHDPRFQFVKGDVRDEDAVAAALRGASAVVHLAALVGEPACARDEDEALAVNRDAVVALARAACAEGTRQFVFASTCSNYGCQPGEFVDEGSPLVPLSLYARSKINAEEALFGLAGGAFGVTVLRFATVFGLSPRMRFDTLLNEFCRDAFCERWLLVYGQDSWRPFVHVQDVAQFVAFALNTGLQGIYNVGGHNRRKELLAEYLATVVPGLAVEYKDSSTDPRDYRVCFDKAKMARDCFGRTPERGMDEIVAALESGVFQNPREVRYGNV